MRKDRFLSRRGREEGLINVTPFWAILMANVKDPEPGGGAARNVHERHRDFRKRVGGGGPEEEPYILKTVITQKRLSN